LPLTRARDLAYYAGMLTRALRLRRRRSRPTPIWSGGDFGMARHP